MKANFVFKHGVPVENIVPRDIDESEKVEKIDPIEDTV